MRFDARTIYELLPAVYRIRDAEEGEPLKALLTVIAGQVAVIEEDLDQLYDDQFIETCADWVVPYIGDMIGVRGLHGVVSAVASPRAEVADTIAFRRRKGTAAVLEELAHSVTGWPARVVEFFELLGWTQYMNHVRPGRGGTLSLRDHNACELVTYAGGAFDRSAHTVDVRHIAARRGRYNIPNIGLFMWRLQSYPIALGAPREVAPGCYTFNPLGLDAPLFNNPVTESAITDLAGEINVPALLRRRELHDELEALRTSSIPAPHFGAHPVVEVLIEDSQTPPAMVPAKLIVCDLRGNAPWRRPPAGDLTVEVAFDPVLGRLALRDGLASSKVQVSYSYGFSANIGGGPYDRQESVSEILGGGVTWQVGVSQNTAPVPGEVFATLTEAVQAWHAQPLDTVGVIAILDSATYSESLTGSNRIQIPQGSQSAKASRLAIVAAEGARPHLRGDISAEGGAGASSQNLGELILNGLLIEGSVIVKPGNLGVLEVVHSSIVPRRDLPGTGSLVTGTGVLKVEAASPAGNNSNLRLSLDHSICGRIELADEVPTLTISGSIVSRGMDGDPDPTAITASGADADLSNSTVLGATLIRTLEASNAIFTEVVEALRVQSGCARFSYLPIASRSPRRFRCQPQNQAGETRVNPQFESETYGDPGFAQLSRRCAVEITEGADDEAEMGAFHDLFQPQRETNLRTRLDEYLRFGLEAGVFFVT